MREKLQRHSGVREELALAVFAPVLAAVGALAALVAEFKVEIVRDKPEEESGEEPEETDEE